MDINQLILFQKIAKNPNISVVAHELGLSQPALSNAIKRIEDEVGEKLFVRQGRNLILNEQGKILLDTAYNMQKLYHRALLSLQERVTEQSVTITMTVPDEKLFDTIHLFNVRYPDIKFTLYSSSVAPAHIQLSASDFLLVLEHEAETSSRVPFDCLETLFAILPSEHPLAARESLTLNDLREEYFVFIRDRRQGRFELSYQECISSGFTPKVSIETETLLDKYACIRERCGIGIAYRQQIAIPSHMAGFRVIPTQSVNPEKRICLAWQKGHLSGPGRLFIDFIREQNELARGSSS